MPNECPRTNVQSVSACQERHSIAETDWIWLRNFSPPVARLIWAAEAYVGSAIVVTNGFETCE